MMRWLKTHSWWVSGVPPNLCPVKAQTHQANVYLSSIYLVTVLVSGFLGYWACRMYKKEKREEKSFEPVAVVSTISVI